MKKLIALALFLGASALAAYFWLRNQPPRPQSSQTLTSQVNTVQPASAASGKKILLWDIHNLSDPASNQKVGMEPTACHKKLSLIIDQITNIEANKPSEKMQKWTSESCENLENYQTSLDQYEQYCRVTWHLDMCKASLVLLKAHLGSELLGNIEANKIEDLPKVFTKLMAYNWKNPDNILPYINRGLELDGQNQVLLTAKYAVTANDFLQHHDHLLKGWDELDNFFHEIMDSKLVTDDRVVEIHLVLQIVRGENFDSILNFLETYRDIFRNSSVYKYLRSSVLYKQKKTAEAVALLKECKIETPKETRCQETLDLISAMPPGQFHGSAYSARLDVLPLLMDNLE